MRYFASATGGGLAQLMKQEKIMGSYALPQSLLHVETI